MSWVEKTNNKSVLSWFLCGILKNRSDQVHFSCFFFRKYKTSKNKRFSVKSNTSCPPRRHKIFFYCTKISLNTTHKNSKRRFIELNFILCSLLIRKRSLEWEYFLETHRLLLTVSLILFSIYPSFFEFTPKLRNWLFTQQTITSSYTKKFLFLILVNEFNAIIIVCFFIQSKVNRELSGETTKSEMSKSSIKKFIRC